MTQTELVEEYRAHLAYKDGRLVVEQRRRLGISQPKPKKARR